MLDSIAPIDPALRHHDVEGLKQWLRAYCTARIDFELADERKCFPPHVVLDFGNKGMFGLTVAQSDGGLGLTNSGFAEIIMQLGAIDPTLCLFVGLSNVLGIRPLEQFGQPGVREQYLKELARGRLLGAFALTEPAAGSAPQAMQTTARRCGDDFVIDGVKHWIGNASWCGLIYVFARTIGEGGGFEGITCFLIDRNAEGLQIGPEAKTMGMRATAQSRVQLHGVRVSVERVLGKVGGGLEVAQDAMMRGRLVIAAAAVGGIKRCAVLAERYARRRHISTGLLVEHPVTRRKISELVCRATAVESLVFPVLNALDRGVPAPQAILAACKIAASELLGEAADELVQILGGRGYIEPNIAPRILRDARILRIFEGPTEPLLGYLGSIADRSPEDIVAFVAASYPGSAPVERALADLAELKAAMSQSKLHLSSIDRRLLVREFGGRLMTWALLAAAQSVDCVARSWLEGRYQSTLCEIEYQIANADRAFDNLPRKIDEFCCEIGDLDPLEIGEDARMDPFLRQKWDPFGDKNFGESTDG